MARAFSKLARQAWLAVPAGLAIVFAIASPAKASVISSTPTLPLLDVPYIAASGVGCFPAAGVCVAAGTFTMTSLVSSLFNASGQDIVTNIDYVGTLTTLANTPIGPVNLSGTFEQEVLGRTFSTEIGTWATQALSLSLSGPALGHTLTLQLDPGQTSTGQTTITQVGDSFRIDSFFDVFVELSLDSVPPLDTTRGPIEVVANTPLPAALPLFAASLGLGLIWRRKRKTAS